ncbi:MAG: hypothetical protein HS111_06860 [Kofleriaceae bacterium]|nr:hypothetical protein [Kofleriaceae bacterium]MCL4225584.1 hypothetical protein [Myxococcales bacterium]
MDQYEFETDDDTRNARVRVIRHPGNVRPGVYPTRPYQPAVYPAPAPMYPPAGCPAYAPQPVIVQRPAVRRFSDLTTGDIAHLASQALAALQALPAAPAPVGATETDVANLITYQAALAQHAKRDEQLRTIGSFIAKLLG